MSLRIVRPGLLTTVQDRGRFGLQHIGVVPCGAMDPVALELANGLVGNRADEAVLEVTVLGPEIVFESDALVALCGAEMEARLGGESMPANRPVFVGMGTVLNHSKFPNVIVYFEQSPDRVDFYALRDIEPGEQLTHDYNYEEYPPEWRT